MVKKILGIKSCYRFWKPIAVTAGVILKIHCWLSQSHRGGRHLDRAGCPCQRGLGTDRHPRCNGRPHQQWSGAVAELTAAQIAKLDAGSWKSPEFAEEKIPTLEEALALTLESNVIFNVEVKKFAGGQRDAKRLTDLLQRYAPRGSTHIVSSFDLEALLQVRQADDSIPLALLGSQGSLLLPEAVKHHFPWIHCYFRTVNRELMSAAHRQNIKVMIWTVDQPALLQHYIRLDVDKICSNYIAEMILA